MSTSTMKAYQLRPGAGVAELAFARIPIPQPRPHEVLIKTHAAALNYRDLMYARGNYINLADAPLVPAGDGAGEIVAVGAEVTRFAVGDRVTHSYFESWIDGKPDPYKTAAAFGTHINGTLAEFFVAPQDTLVAITGVLSRELGPRNIRVNAVNPGMVETEGTHAAGFIGSDFNHHPINATPLHRPGIGDYKSNNARKASIYEHGRTS